MDAMAEERSGGCKGRARGVARRYADRDLGERVVVTKRDSERTGCLNSRRVGVFAVPKG